MKALALVLAFRIFQLTLSAHHAAPGCAQGTPLPSWYAFGYLRVECSHDSLAWREVARWGLALVPPGGAYRIVAWPDTTLAPGDRGIWYRVIAVNAADSASCPSAPVRLK